MFSVDLPTTPASDLCHDLQLKVRAKLDKEMQKTMTELRAKFSQADWGMGYDGL